MRIRIVPETVHSMRLAALALLYISPESGAQATWTRLPVGPGPGAMSGVPASYDLGRNVTVFHTWGQTWEFDGSNWINRTSGIGPRNGWFVYDFGRSRHVLYELPPQSPPWTQPQTTWEWDGQTWTSHGIAGAPALLGRAGMAYDPRRNAVILTGPDQANAQRVGTWAWSGTQWTRVPLQFEGYAPLNSQTLVTDWVRRRVLAVNFLSVGTPQVVGTLFLDDTGWHLIPGTETAPYRPTTAVVQDPLRDRVIMFSGSSFGAPCGVVNETWEFDGMRWFQRFPANSPPAILGAGVTYNFGFS